MLNLLTIVTDSLDLALFSQNGVSPVALAHGLGSREAAIWAVPAIDGKGTKVWIGTVQHNPNIGKVVDGEIVEGPMAFLDGEDVLGRFASRAQAQAYINGYLDCWADFFPEPESE